MSDLSGMDVQVGDLLVCFGRPVIVLGLETQRDGLRLLYVYDVLKKFGSHCYWVYESTLQRPDGTGVRLIRVTRVEG